MQVQPGEDPKPDVEEIARHLRHLTRRWSELDEPCLLEIVHLSPEDKAQVKQVAHYAPDDMGVSLAADDMGVSLAADDIAAFNALRINAYVTVNPVSATNRPKAGRRASAEHIVASFFHFADADTAEAAENIRNFVGPKATFQVITGTQPCVRPHVYWELEEPTRNLDAWSRTQAAISDTLNTDRVIDPPRIMRLGGTVNWPKPQKAAKGYVAELTRFKVHEDRPPVTSERMARAFTQAAASSSDKPHIDLGPQPLDREKARTQALSGQEWHNNLIKSVASLVSKGLSDDEIQRFHSDWTLEGYTAAETAREVQTAIDGARAKGWTPEPQKTIRIDTSAAPENTGESDGLDWFADIEPHLADSYLIKGVLASEALSAVYGPSNSGKTFFVMDMTFHIAAGKEWRGRRVHKAAVLYLASEGGRGVINRIAALKKETGVTDLPFAVRRAGMDLLQSEADLQSIYNLAQTVKAKSELDNLVIVVDTLSRAMAGGDENAPQDMTAFIRNIDAIRSATNAHVILVHHTGKDAARGARGHSSLRAAVDTEIELQVEDNWRAAFVSKQRDYNGGDTFAFDLKSVSLGIDQDGDEVTSCVVVEADENAQKKPRKLAKNQKVLVDVFDMLKGEGIGKPNPGGAMMPEPGRHWCMEMDRFREACEGKLTAKNTRSAFLDAFDALLGENGVFCMASGLVWRTDRTIQP